jgi:diguanylate cyclase (GGDEF)-like protein
MAQLAEQDARPTGIFLNPMARRRAGFEAACGDLFARLDTVDSVAMAQRLLALDAPGLLVIDLERFESGIDLAALGALVADRAATGRGTTLVLCPYATARWLPALMACGPLAYAITPADPARLRAAVMRALGAPAQQPADGRREAGLLELRSRVQATLAAAADVHDLSEGLCAALCGWPGVVHAAVFALQPDGDLQLVAQQAAAGKPGLVVGNLLGGTARLLQAPLRHAFPGLLAAVTGEMALLDTLDGAGEPELAAGLRAHGVAMAAGWPIPADGPGPARGALSLLFDGERAFARDEFAALDDVARLAAFGMRLAETVAENDGLLARLTYVSTMDALTGAANRRHGEDLLEKEIRRARRYRLPLALIAFDIDRFKLINDTYGYPVGDVALRTVADATRAVLRGSDILVRSGGEEFHIIAPHTSAIDGLKVAEKVRLAIAQTPIPGCDHLTVSLGVAQLGEQESGDSLTGRAEAALARAKRAGRNCVELAMQ